MHHSELAKICDLQSSAKIDCTVTAYNSEGVGPNITVTDRTDVNCKRFFYVMQVTC